MRAKQNKHFKLYMRVKKGKPRKEWEQYIGEIARDRLIKLKKKLEKMVQDRYQYRKFKWPNLKDNKER